MHSCNDGRSSGHSDISSANLRIPGIVPVSRLHLNSAEIGVVGSKGPKQMVQLSFRLSAFLTDHGSRVGVCGISSLVLGPFLIRFVWLYVYIIPFLRFGRGKTNQHHGDFYSWIQSRMSTYFETFSHHNKFDHVIYSLPGYELSHPQWNKARLPLSILVIMVIRSTVKHNTKRYQECTWHEGTLYMMSAESATANHSDARSVAATLSFISLPCEIRLREEQCSWSDLGCVLKANSSKSKNRLVHATAVWGEIASSHCAVGQLTFISPKPPMLYQLSCTSSYSINLYISNTIFIPIRYQTLHQTLYRNHCKKVILEWTAAAQNDSHHRSWERGLARRFMDSKQLSPPLPLPQQLSPGTPQPQAASTSGSWRWQEGSK